jgi:hypothetical protein
MGYFNKFKRTAYDIDGTGTYQPLVNLTSNVAISNKLIENIAFYANVAVGDGERMEQLSYRLYGTPSYYWTFLLINKNIKNIWNDWPKSNYQILEYCSKKYDGVAGIVKDKSLTSATFSVGEEVYTSDINYAKATVESIHTNEGYIVLSPMAYCYGNGDDDNKAACIESGGVWKVPNLLSDQSVTIKSILDSSKFIEVESIVKHMDAPHHHLDENNMIETYDIGGSLITAVSLFEYERYMNDNNRMIRAVKPEHINALVKEFEKEIGK